MLIMLRPVAGDDEPLLLRIYASTREQELAFVPWSDQQKDAFAAMQFAAQSAHYAQHYAGLSAVVVLIDGEAAGRLLVARWAEEIRIVDITLLPEFRGRGAGGELLAALIGEATVAGKRLSIHVERNNRALGLYERLGFRPVGETAVYLKMERDPAGATVIR
ncbi:MAG: GNAT family N-acetyltransferase [Pseudonocardiales bacterium]|nr:MAG: GNAT family N-acetyltransferase [Pseudonocardiales bacterium]